MSLSIKFVNFSKYEFDLWTHKDSLTVNETMNSAPSAKLLAHSGTAAMAASQNMGQPFGTDVYAIRCGYQIISGTMAVQRIAVYCQSNLQILGIGAAPTWKYVNGANENYEWVDVGSNATPVTFDRGDLTYRLTPTVTHDSINVEVTITDKK